MRLTPRKEEIEKVKAILESDDFTSADQMAKALISEVADVLWMRDWWALAHIDITGRAGLNWAPFASPTEAQRVATKVGVQGTFRAVKLYSPGVMLANAEGKKGWKGYCQDPGCGHASFLHLSKGSGRGACGLTSMCKCSEFVK
ncbi:hypothetical protein [Actinoplanes sp. NPDC049118]|uniref:hypothetical protein n=1 Tax=Actinoplanes sp. NPDC049118 TaxID=3155769 RepID=UPI0033E12309